MRSVKSALDPNASSKNRIREMWDGLHRLPGGKRVFSRLVGMAAPYTGSIGAQVIELRRGHAEVVLKDRRAVRNHLQCVHAIALANLAELTGNVAVAYSLPDDARFIVAGISLDYLKKARGTITGVCDCPIVESSEKREYAVTVSMRDESGTEVTRATLRTLVGPKK
jgi:acyl-coenzyme A thioesterase PaaI-like protein